MKARNLFILEVALAVLGAIVLAALASRRPEVGAKLLSGGLWMR